MIVMKAAMLEKYLLRERTILRVIDVDSFFGTAKAVGAMLSRYCSEILGSWTRTTDAQRGNILHCTAKNSLPLPIF